MAHITSIKIGGLLGRPNPIEITFKRDVNIFFGENGCGKSTLLRILHAALERNETLLEALPVSYAEVNIYSIHEDKIFKHAWERKSKEVKKTALGHIKSRQTNFLELFETENTPLRSIDTAITSDKHGWRITPAPSLEVSKTRWAHKFLPTTRLYVNDEIARTNPAARMQVSEAGLEEAFIESVNRTWLLYYSQTLQEVRKIQEEGLRAVLSSVIGSNNKKEAKQNGNPAEAYERVTRFLSRQPSNTSLSLGTKESFNKRYAKEVNLRRVVDNLDNIEQRIERAMVPIEQFKDTAKSLLSNGKSLSVSNHQLQVVLATGRTLSAGSLSSGEKHLLKILLDVMTAGPGSVIIDEPELSMHVDWQSVFVKTVQSLNPQCQLILASHSPEIMAGISDDRIVRL